MDVRRMMLAACSVLLLACGNAYAQDGVKRAITNPFDKQLLVEFDGGTLAIADDSTQKFYITASNGQEYQVSFAAAAAAAESNPTKRQQRIQLFRTSLTDSKHMIAVRSRRVAFDTTYWPRYEWCGPVICIDPESARSAAIDALNTASNARTCDHWMCQELPWPCDSGPCSPNNWGDDLMLYTSSLAGWGDDQGGGSITQQDLVAYDKKLWESHRQDSCNEKNVVAASTSATGAATVVSCALSETGFGAIGCAAGVMGYGIGLYQTDQKTKQCFSSYPGMGNW